MAHVKLRIGVVGSEAGKFTPETEFLARRAITTFLTPYLPQRDTTEVRSGKCHRGGIDIWSIDIARTLGFRTREFPATVHRWEGEGGFAWRNRLIADSDRVVCVTVRQLPVGYTGKPAPLCYHCGTRDHIVSGGCWTVKYARQLGRPAEVIVVG